MNRINITIVLCLLIFIMTTGFSCTPPPTSLLRKAIVQVWRPPNAIGETGELESFGVIVGNGSQVLTILDYEDYTPNTLMVVTQDYGKYTATIQIADPRTGMTLLKLDGARLPVATVGNSSIPAYGQEVRIWGWRDSSQPAPTSFKVVVTADQAPRPLFFSVSYLGGSDIPDIPGTVVADRLGNVLGLTTTFHTRLAVVLGPVGRVPPVASINSALELLSGKFGLSQWASRSTLSAIADSSGMSGYFAGILPSPSNYDEMSVAVQDLLGRLGDPLNTDDLYFDNTFWYQSLQGTMLIVVFPDPVTLKNVDGKTLAQAKWVGIEWDRLEGKPNRLVYGDVAYTIKGGFELVGDLTNLQQSVPPPGSPEDL